MRRVCLFFLAGPFALLAFATLAAAAPLPRSVSTSRQFIVFGPDARLRGAMCELAERTKVTALSLLQEKDDWKTPVVINAQFPQANLPELPPAHLNFAQTGFGLKLQLDLSIGAEVNVPAIERELLRAIYLEMMYRQQSDVPAGTVLIEPPDWLLDGTLARQSGRDPATLIESLRTASTGGRVVSLGEFLQQRPALLEGPSRLVYRGYSAALVNMLTQMPSGRKRLARFVAELPQASTDSLGDLRAHFPALGRSLEATEKTWSGAVAQWSAGGRFHLLSCAETEEQLVRTLRVSASASDQPPNEYTLEEFPKFVRLPSAPTALKSLTHDLQVLAGRASPLYLPVIFQYEKIAAQLARRKTHRVAQRLAEARALREQIGRVMGEIEDYMNWFEATQARTASGAFHDYLKAAELALEKTPRRRDRISVYLDSVEALVQH